MSRSPRESHTLSINLSIASHDLSFSTPKTSCMYHRPACRRRRARGPTSRSLVSGSALRTRRPAKRRLRLATRPTLARIRSRPYSQQILDLIATPDLYVREGFGFVYVGGRVDNAILADYRAGHLTRAEFLDRLLIKIGHAQFLDVRQRAYDKCDDGQTHLWFFAFCPTRRIVSERLCHLRFLADGALRVIEECRGCLVRHREYWRYRDVGPFSRIEQQTRRIFASLGEPGLPRHDLADVAVAFPNRN
ncbi:hypothetical protein B0H15DRAFT_954692 [Mycena belliarum]|uniref:Uncharacterized protein n=1 Tax=Mycena belliarum TaxID=1033014 RepID=A0AAD6XP71_9AGAR|nr:hypothetical protein B0H15DRAFT_954692 [Mycena belliae]